MVCAFRGWNDAAAAASTALAAIGNALDSEIVASIDPEEYFDFQSTRPTITMTAGETRRIEWPENNLIAVRVPAADFIPGRHLRRPCSVAASQRRECPEG